MHPEISKCFHSSGITLSLSSVNNQNLTNILKLILNGRIASGPILVFNMFVTTLLGFVISK